MSIPSKQPKPRSLVNLRREFADIREHLRNIDVQISGLRTRGQATLLDAELRRMQSELAASMTLLDSILAQLNN